MNTNEPQTEGRATFASFGIEVMSHPLADQVASAMFGPEGNLTDEQVKAVAEMLEADHGARFGSDSVGPVYLSDGSGVDMGTLVTQTGGRSAAGIVRGDRVRVRLGASSGWFTVSQVIGADLVLRCGGEYAGRVAAVDALAVDR